MHHGGIFSPQVRTEKTSNTGLEYLPYKFTAKELDAETGLYYYGARYLDPKYSMWISCDLALGEYLSQTSKGEGGIYNSVNLNLYHYGANNPVKYVAPDGRTDEDFLSNTWQKTTEWHYEMRDEKNTINEFKNSADAYSVLEKTKDGSVIDGWKYEHRDSCHQNGDEYRDEKYCNRDGREIVFDGKSIAENNPKIDTNNLTRGTFNYCDPGEKPTDENGKNNILGWAEYAAKGTGHLFADLIPWYILGNSRGEDTSPKGVYNRIRESLNK